ncbi:Probable transcriptional regulatory protein YehT [Serratia fonticola]|uniref:Probable transcriptional regulatory protein YehT n=1 Tax=Serratia fonticola TaxID=47917 RepID=A0A4U9UAC8_SERFO|nr:Probable transcriptional regulatory protein YehT [Serratia fonticola]
MRLITCLKPAEPTRLNKTLQRLHQRRAPQNIAALDESAGYLKYIPCTGHSRIYLLRFDEVIAIRSRSTGCMWYAMTAWSVSLN